MVLNVRFLRISCIPHAHFTIAHLPNDVDSFLKTPSFWVHLARHLHSILRAQPFFAIQPDVDAAPVENRSMCLVQTACRACLPPKSRLRRIWSSAGLPPEIDVSLRNGQTAPFLQGCSAIRAPRIQQAHTPYAILHSHTPAGFSTSGQENPFGPNLPPFKLLSQTACRGRPRGITPRPYSRR
jgi:hypothetical protein